MSLGNEIQVGVISGNASTVIVRCGFVPDYVEVIDTTNRNLRAVWFSNMSNGTAVKLDASSMGSLTSEGVSAVSGDDDEAAGFKIGTTLSVNAAQLGYVAVRSNIGLATAASNTAAG